MIQSRSAVAASLVREPVPAYRSPLICRRRSTPRGLRVVPALTVLTVVTVTGIGEASEAGDVAAVREPPAVVVDGLPNVECSWPCYAHLLAGVGIGRGLRLNNPFRLQTPLGENAASLSWSATYADVSFAALLGNPFGYQHGPAISASFALDGIAQQVIAPAYAARYPLGIHWGVRGRLGLPVVISPDANVGLDVALGLSYLVRASLGVFVDAIYSVYEGAATDRRPATLVPLVSLQVGIALSYEVLP